MQAQHLADHHWLRRDNLTLLTDFYELTMSQGYFKQGFRDLVVTFDMFFRDIPEHGGYAIMAGVEQLAQYLADLTFTPEDIAYLRSLHMFDEDFLHYLETFDFQCDVDVVPEGVPIFPQEPIVKVRGPVIQAQLLETMILCTINHQSLIATKASRIVRAAGGRPVMEFGARRAQSWDASVLGARAAYIGGVAGTSNTLCAQLFQIPALGTMAHSWVQAYPSEFDAFKAYAEVFPDQCQLLVDTYDTLRSGIPNAIRTAKEVLAPLGHRLQAVRIDSGDVTYLTNESRRLLDEAGLEDCGITISNSMDEYLIQEVLRQGAKIDAFGVGERLITAKQDPVFSGVYKLSSVQVGDHFVPRMKFSDNPEKITNPGDKEVWRFYEKSSGKAIADVIALTGEVFSEAEPLTIFHPQYTWKRKRITDFRVRKLLQPLCIKGELVQAPTDLKQIRKRCQEELDTLWDTHKRLDNPQEYYVDLSQNLWDLKNQMLHDQGKHE